MIEPFLFFLIHVDYAISLFDLRLDPSMEESVTKKKKKKKSQRRVNNNNNTYHKYDKYGKWRSAINNFLIPLG